MSQQFCGWYFKCQTEGTSLALIPAMHTAGGQQTCSLQLITRTQSHTLLPDVPCRMEAGRPRALLGDSVFSERGIRLRLTTPALSLCGQLRFGAPTPLRYDIMGPFRCLAGMECRHRVFSMRHTVNGTVLINGKRCCLDGGVGYIEGDRGRSFPKRYLWTQCCFEGGSLMLAVADIPLGAVNFSGVIGAVVVQGREYRLATYLGARIVSNQNRRVVIRQGKLTLTAELLEAHCHPLQAPADGAMTRTIRENLACRARYQLCRGKQTLLALESTTASFEYEYGEKEYDKSYE